MGSIWSTCEGHAIIGIAIAERESKAEQVIADCAGARVDQDEHGNVLGKARAHAAHADLQGRSRKSQLSKRTVASKGMGTQRDGTAAGGGLCMHSACWHRRPHGFTTC